MNDDGNTLLRRIMKELGFLMHLVSALSEISIPGG
jgi:hypothetical protein